MIEWAGTRASDLHLITEHIPKRKIPRRKIEVASVPGRSGDIILSQDAFSDYEQQYSVFVDSKKYGSLDTIMPAITEWLLGNPGYQRLEDSFEPQFYRLAYVSGGEEFVNIFNEYGEGTLTFICDPRRFYKDGEMPISIASSGKSLYGPSNFKSKPIIKVHLNEAVSDFTNADNSIIRFNNNKFVRFKSVSSIQSDITGITKAGYYSKTTGKFVSNGLLECREWISAIPGCKYYYTGRTSSSSVSRPFVQYDDGTRASILAASREYTDVDLSTASAWNDTVKYIVANSTIGGNYPLLKVKAMHTNALTFEIDTERHVITSDGVPVNDCFDGRYEDLELEKVTTIFYGSNIQSIEIIPRWFTI